MGFNERKLADACKQGDIDTVKKLILKNVNVENTDTVILFHGIYFRDISFLVESVETDSFCMRCWKR